MDETRPSDRFVEGEEGEKKKVYLPKVDKEDGDMRRMLDMQKSTSGASWLSATPWKLSSVTSRFSNAAGPQ